MVQHEPARSTIRNCLLAALPHEDLISLWPKLEPMELVQRRVLAKQGDLIRFIIFPEVGWASNLVTLEDGSVAEVGLTGREGMIGLPLLFGDDRNLTESLVQASGIALRLSAAAFRDALGESSTLHAFLLRYALAFHMQVAQTAACNGRHHLVRRLARWLLMSHDRSGGEAFPMTHEFLSMMLGVRRAGVSVAAGALQQAGYIRYERGVVAISDRSGLEAASCECYGVVRRESERLLGAPGSPFG